ncbi:ER lumen protein retaining receptor [Corchorus olitorius]|uniref:ER lumen protein retaining receptor n=1 Tax=Corchorus olitorius TaxID=93759 RepID=A0A1R3GVZ6_9ROSI|nr:ER lumen protein retaining receptor [Corchorus olitorius]
MKLVFIGTSICIVWYMRYHKVVKQTYSKDQDTFRHYFLIPPCLLLALLIHPAFNVMEVLWAFSLYLEAVAILPQLVLLQRSIALTTLIILSCLALVAVLRVFGAPFSGITVYSFSSLWCGGFKVSGPSKRVLIEHDAAKIEVSCYCCEVVKIREEACLCAVPLLHMQSHLQWHINKSESSYLTFLANLAYRALYLINWVYRFFAENHKFRWIPWLSGLVQTALYADFFYYYFKSWKNHEKLKLPA